MGDRISISFKDEMRETPALFSHWRGMDLLQQVEDYLKELDAEQTDKGKGQFSPLDRMEAGTVFIDFVRWLTKGQDRVTSDLYIGKDRNDGDNSDNGHFVIDLRLKDPVKSALGVE